VAARSAVGGERLQATACQIAERVELTSVASIQIKEASDGEPALLEINPCFGGTMPLTVASGMNMPKFCVDEALGLPLPENVVPFERQAMISSPLIGLTAKGLADG